MWYNEGINIVVPERCYQHPQAWIHLIGDVPMDTLPHSTLSDNYTIYALLDPRDDCIKYVGLSTDPQRRLRAHLTDREATPQKRAWLDELIVLNLIPAILPLETGISGVREGRVREKFWIQELLQAGESLLNSPPIGGRLRCRHHIEEILAFYQTFGEFPDGVSPAMQRYYKREYPKFFKKRRIRTRSGSEGRSMRC